MLPEGNIYDLDRVYNPCDLQIIMKTGNKMPEDTQFDFYLYDDTYTLMGLVRQSVNNTSYVVEGTKIDAIMPVNMPWTEGKYTLLTDVIHPKKNERDEWEEVVQTNMVVEDAPESLEAEMTFHVVETKQVKGITPEYILATSLSHRKNTPWCSYCFQTIPGIMPIRHWLIRYKQWEMLNAQLEKGKANPILFSNNYIVSTKGEQEMFKLPIFFKQIGFSDFPATRIDCTELYDGLNPSDPYHKVKKLFPERDASDNIFTCFMGFGGKDIYIIKNIGILSTPKGEPILKALMYNVFCNNPDRVIFMMGTEQEVDAMMKKEPSLRVFFEAECKATVGELSYPDILRYMYFRARKGHGMNFDVAAEAVLRVDIRKGYFSGALRGWTADDVENYLAEKLKPRYLERVSDGVEVKDILATSSEMFVGVDDIDRSALRGEDVDEDSFDDEEEEEEENQDDTSTEDDEHGTPEKEKTAEEPDDDFERMLNEIVKGISDSKSTKEESDSPSPYDDLDIADDDADDLDSNPAPFSHELDPDDEDDLGIHEPKAKFQVLPQLKDPKAEMSKLVGCTDIKERIEQLTMLSRYNKVMEKVNPGGKSHEISLHSIFFGKPGTGKTTVCKIMGSLLRRSGALSRGHVVVCSRKDFIGTRWGDEERVVRQAVEKAQGGVLMIDEAYQLVSSNPWDPGRLVIPLLMDILSDEKQRDIAIVLCGYKDEMKKLIDLNPGLTSRFPNVFEFKDFTVEELLEITRRRVSEYGYEFTKAAWRKYRGIIEDAYQARDANTWGNARFVANLLDKTYLNHAMRCMKKSKLDRHHLCQITPADVQPIEVAKPKPRIGF